MSEGQLPVSPRKAAEPDAGGCPSLPLGWLSQSLFIREFFFNTDSDTDPDPDFDRIQKTGLED
jgi:hypothetical protein